VNQVQELERAILARAERLASEYRDRAQRSRDNILREASERLRLREQREEAIAKALGERTFRQQVQASELKLQSQVDRMRWNLVRDVERHLKVQMQNLMADETTYLSLLQDLLTAAARQIEGPELVVEANAADHKRLSAAWASLSEAAAPGRRLALAEDPINTLGGVLVRNTDNTMRVDNTFEGRLDRLRPRVQQVILERLLPSGFDTGNLFTG
jgi:V/A-type H+/Na+-transporting ATPase subunit E